MISKTVVCKECGEEQVIKRTDVRVETPPIDIPFVTPLYYYNCCNCKAKNRLWQEDVPTRA